jgi:WD40 repeat protein
MTIRLWDVRTGRQRAELPVGDYTLSVLCVAFSGDGKRLTAVDFFGMIRTWDAETGRLLSVVPTYPNGERRERDFTNLVRAAALSPNGKTVATARDETIQLWDARTGRLRASLAGHNGLIQALAFRPDGRQLASTAQDGTVKLWDVVAPEHGR